MIRKISTLNFSAASLAAVFLLIASTSVFAAGVATSFTYSGLYKSIKTAAANDYSQIALNFYLFENGKNKEIACPIESGYISDGANKIDLTMNERGRMLLPLDKSLKQDRAAITIITPTKDMCHLSMRIEVASFELTNTNLTSINGWIKQISALFSELAGWPGRYFMPELIGLNFKFADSGLQSVYFVDAGSRQLIAQSETDGVYLSLSKIEQLPEQGYLEFSNNLIAVTPQLSE